MKITTETHVTVAAKVNLVEVIESILDDLSEDEVIKFIAQIDTRSGSWEFSKKLYDYAMNMRKEHDDEVRRGITSGYEDETELWDPTVKEAKTAEKLLKERKKENKRLKKMGAL